MVQCVALKTWVTPLYPTIGLKRETREIPEYEDGCSPPKDLDEDTRCRMNLKGIYFGVLL